MAIELLDILSASTVVTTILQFLSGILVCRKCMQRKSTENVSAMPFISGFLSCSLWLKYGLLTSEASVVLVNIAGTCLMFCYTIIFYVLSTNKKVILRQFATVLLVLVSVVAYTQYETELSKSIEILGIICCTVTVLFFAAPLTMLLHVIRVKNSDSLPFPMILTSFFVCLQWFIYGVIIQDTFIQIPNFVGCVLTVLQLTLFLIYPGKSSSGPSYKLLDTNVIMS
uniref:Sugar transporter SWEET n=1 Tax=Phlebotomus papatasi TaxID=29031 RepID=A0A1B0CYW3_PHLPP